ncbi:MAG: M48 family metalloprotease [Acidiferrobacter sp.]
MRGTARRTATVVLVLGLAIPAAGAATIIGHLPDLGHPSATVMSRRQQRQFGDRFLRHARTTLRFVTNPAVIAVVRALGDRLVAASLSPALPFHFYVVKNPVVNAFAVPGGYIFINTGAILAARNEDELAAVMAHEISHVTQRHIPRLMALSQQLSWASLIGLLAGAALLSTSQFNGGMAALTLSSAGIAHVALHHRRGYEAEADHIGLRTMARAGFNPRAMATFFTRLKTDNQFTSVNVPSSWRTHPATDLRIAEAENLAASYPNRPIPDRPPFDRLQATLIADHGSPAVTRAQLRTRFWHRHDRSARQYGLALVAIRTGHTGDARRSLTALTRAAPRVLAYRLALARLAFATGHYRAARRAWRQAAAQRPGSVWLAIMATRSLLDSGATTPGLIAARRLVMRYPKRPALYRLLARAYALHGNYLYAHEALATAHALDFDRRAALRDLAWAASLATTPAQRSRVQAEITAVKTGMRVPPAFP